MKVTVLVHWGIDLPRGFEHTKGIFRSFQLFSVGLRGIVESWTEMLSYQREATTSTLTMQNQYGIAEKFSQTLVRVLKRVLYTIYTQVNFSLASKGVPFVHDPNVYCLGVI